MDSKINGSLRGKVGSPRHRTPETAACQLAFAAVAHSPAEAAPGWVGAWLRIGAALEDLGVDKGRMDIAISSAKCGLYALLALVFA